MKGKYEKITNYNLSYENLLEAIAEFEGFITGVSNEDILLFNNKNKDILSYGGTASVKPESSQEKALNIFLKDISSRILDRTTGGYFINDLVNGRVHDAYFQHATNYFSILEKLGNLSINQHFQGPTGLGDFMHIIMPTSFQASLDTNNSNIFSSCFRDNLHMNDAIKYYNTSKRLSKTEKTRSDGSTVYDKDNNPVQRYSLSNNAFTDLGNIEINSNSEGDRYKRPNLGAIVMRHPKVSIAGRNKSHLPIFFNAISPIEMSRCTPYISIGVVTQDFGTDGNKISNMNQVGFMRFSKGSGSEYKLDDTGGIFNTSPTSDKSGEASSNENNSTRYSYMDIFNSPQTMANANINKGNKNIFSLNHNNNDPVLDPIMPMMTLNSANISITGAGFGLMASKKGSIKLTLHDRSRMRDIAPLISSTQFTSTKIVVEFGWNHPEGGVNSDNVIGKYLNGLKDRSIFQVVGTDYSFGGGNSVSITIDLAAYGYRQNEKIHCGSGPEVPLNIFEDMIKKVASDLSAKNNDGDFKETPEVRQLVKLNSRNARSVNASISWAAYDAIFKSINNSDNTEEFKSTVLAFLKKEGAGNNEDINSDPENKDLVNQIQSAEKEVKDQVSRMLGKLKDIQTTEPKDDPFSGSTVTGTKLLSYDASSSEGEKETQKTTTLGKVISHFIGHPIASSCLYDEVQLFFYPINHHAAGGRVHTTASFPIPIKKLEDEIDKKLNSNPSVSVNAFFSMLEKIVRDRNLNVYGLVDLYTDLNTLKSTSNDIVLLKMKEMFSKGELENLNIDDPIKASILGSASNQESFKDFEKDILLGGAAKEAFESSKDLNTEYKSTVARLTSELNTVEINIANLEKKNAELEESFNEALKNVDAEAMNSIAERQTASGKTLIDYKGEKVKIKAEIEVNKKLLDGTNAVIELGLTRKKAFDELVAAVKELEYESTRGQVSARCKAIYRDDNLNNLYPAEAKFVRPNIAMDFEVIDAISPPSDTSAKMWEFAKIYKLKNETTNGLKNKTILRIHIYDEEAVIDPASMAIHNAMVGDASEKELVKSHLGLDTNSLNFNDVKQIMKRAYPTIIYGASGSVIKDISVSANTSGDMSKVLMVESYERVKDGQVKGHSYENEYESLITLPNTVSLGMMGQPMIGRGNNVFIDFGTNTSLDNIYTVKTVTHSLAKGDFSTTVQLVPSNIGSISTFKERMRKVIDRL